ncbi:hypothetical protein B0H14DRAFT_3497761 [Mycena olivaceomarginata]|nr:hypothetical protein B0H14DRAFT_3497761 [Mycena olivaceomarginata]
MVVYWDEDHEPHAIFYIHSFLTWPTWQVAEATGHFATLLGDNPDLEVYDPHFKTWASVGPTYPHPVIADKALLLRRRNTRCLALDEVVHTFHPPPSTAPMHFRQNLPAERKALCTVYKDHRSPKPIIIDDTPSSDSDVEVVRFNKRAFNPSAASSPPWPAGMYVVDMVKGFRKMSGLKGMGLNRGQRFYRVFGVQYHMSTFDTQHSKYKAATPTQIEAGVQAGRVDKGLWNVWRKTV